MSEPMIQSNSNAGKRCACERCAKPCRVAATRNAAAKMAVEANDKGLCAECIVTAMVRGLIGDGGGEKDSHRAAWFPNVTAETIRLPHVQKAVASAVVASGSRLPVELLDFDEIAANWHLPIPKKQAGGLFW